MTIELVQLTREECNRVLDALIAISVEEPGFTWTAGQVLQEMPDKWTLSAIARDHEQRVIAFQVSSRTPGHPHLHRIMVTHAWRNAGVGGVLMAWLCRACMERDWKPLTFKVHDTNRGAVKFYRRLGFSIQDTGRLDETVNARLLLGTGDPAQVLQNLESPDSTR
ncbi:MAG: GNAT family N-acetyltransferase [Gemmatimonadaceae bacterium]